jgi:hypothetical protein
MFAIYVYIHEEDVFQDAQNKKKQIQRCQFCQKHV